MNEKILFIQIIFLKINKYMYIYTLYFLILNYEVNSIINAFLFYVIPILKIHILTILSYNLFFVAL
jgi:hypothetical protein